MPHRDRWSHEPAQERDRDFDRDFDAPRHRDDFGQADYSTDYGYDPRTRTGYRTADENAARDDYGQADYSEDFAYDPRNRVGYRRSDPEARRAHQDYDIDRSHDRRASRDDRDYMDPRDDRYRSGEDRSWMDQARDFLGVNAYRERRAGREYRQGRVLWAVINGRMDHERSLDSRDIEVIVDGSEVILNGTVRSREDKRLAEDLADVRGVTHVQNNLRVRHHSGWWR